MGSIYFVTHFFVSTIFYVGLFANVPAYDPSDTTCAAAHVVNVSPATTTLPIDHTPIESAPLATAHNTNDLIAPVKTVSSTATQNDDSSVNNGTVIGVIVGGVGFVVLLLVIIVVIVIIRTVRLAAIIFSYYCD